MKTRFLVLVLALLFGSTAVLRAQFPIINQSSNLVLEAFQPDVSENGCRTQLSRDEGGTHQQWQIEPSGRAGLYRITNTASGLALDAHLFDVQKNDCRIQLWQFLGGRNQLWRIESLGGDLCRITNAASGKVLAAHLFAVNRPGCRIQLWDDLELPNQQWRIPGLFAAGVGEGDGFGAGEPQDPAFGGGDPIDPGFGGSGAADPGNGSDDSSASGFGSEPPLGDPGYGMTGGGFDDGYFPNASAQPCPSNIGYPAYDSSQRVIARQVTRPNGPVSQSGNQRIVQGDGGSGPRQITPVVRPRGNAPRIYPRPAWGR